MKCLTSEPEDKHHGLGEQKQHVAMGDFFFFLEYGSSGAKENDKNPVWKSELLSAAYGASFGLLSLPSPRLMFHPVVSHKGHFCSPPSPVPKAVM